MSASTHHVCLTTGVLRCSVSYSRSLWSCLSGRHPNTRPSCHLHLEYHWSAVVLVYPMYVKRAVFIILTPLEVCIRPLEKPLSYIYLSSTPLFYSLLLHIIKLQILSQISDLNGSERYILLFRLSLGTSSTALLIPEFLMTCKYIHFSSLPGLAGTKITVSFWSDLLLNHPLLSVIFLCICSIFFQL